MRTFLIHGMGRTPASMWILDRRLRGAGYRPSLFGYFVTATDLEEIARRFAAHVQRVLNGHDGGNGNGDVPYGIVSHSLGGLIARLAAPHLPPGLASCVMLAPPNRPPIMARTLKNNPIFRLVTRDTGRKLADPDFYRGLPRLHAPVLVVAGTWGPRGSWLPFDGEPNDSILRLDETRLEGASSMTVPGLHTFLMNRRDVFEAICEFFRHQGFDGEAAA